MATFRVKCDLFKIDVLIFCADLSRSNNFIHFIFCWSYNITSIFMNVLILVYYKGKFRT